jgi:hypothetical protein
MDFYIDTTPFINPINSVNIAPFQSRPFVQGNTERKTMMEHTSFVTAKDSTADFFSVATGPRAPTSPPTSQSALSAESTPTLSESVHSHIATACASSPNSEIDHIAKQRVRLMAVKYAGGKESAEIVARLEILNSRLAERAPLVSKEQVAALENAYDQLAHIRAAREERAKRFGIPTTL